MDPRTPVIIGVGQFSNRTDRGEAALEPVDLMAEATRRAIADANGNGIADAIDSIRVVALMSWRYRNPAVYVGQRIGARADIDHALSSHGGNSPQSLVNITAADIAAGRCDLAVLTGAEAWRTRGSYRSGGDKPPWTVDADDLAPARDIGSNVPMGNDAETAMGIVMPVQVYPMFEQAHRHRLGRTIDDHLQAVGGLWSDFSAVAAKNPHAWIQEHWSAERIITPTADNRMIGYPYTKVMNSNNAVEQGATLIMCSAEKATALGVPRDKWVFPLAGADAHEHYSVSDRADLHSSPAIGVASRSMIGAAGLAVDDIEHVDLYSCFPIAPQIGAQEIGLPLDRQLTLTGGLAFAGGPWNNYVMHSIATMVDVLRSDAGSTGLIWANGGFFTKQALGLYSTEPPSSGWTHVEPQAEIDALPKTALSTDHVGSATVESWTVMHGRDGGPETALFALRLDDGRRAWGRSSDASVLPDLIGTDVIGTNVDRAGDGEVTLR